MVDAGLSFDTVVRTRIMLTDVSQWEAAARARGEFFAAILPATTFIEVKGFINREWLVEVEADCVADRQGISIIRTNAVCKLFPCRHLDEA